MKLKKIKLLWLKLDYAVNRRIGPFVVNERKYPIFLSQMLNMQNKIESLQLEIESETNR
jgi:hypothetical protein